MIKVAAFWIVSDGGELLLAQRSFQKAQDPGVWGPSVTGRLEQGETFEHALPREVEEELGLAPTEYTPHYLFEKTFAHPDGTPRNYAIYYAVLPRDIIDGVRLQADEVEAVAWFTVEEVMRKMKEGPEELVPSANAIWLDTFAALKSAGVL